MIAHAATIGSGRRGAGSAEAAASVSVPATFEVTVITMVPLVVPATIEVPVVMSVVRMTASHTGRAVAWSAEVATIPTVVHTDVVVVMGTIVVAVSVVVAVSAMTVPGMPAVIGGIEVRTSEVEIVPMRVAQIDAEVPVASLPVEWAIEIAGGHEGVPLPVEQDIAHIEVTTLPVGAEHICPSCDAHEVVEVDLVGCFVLRVIQVQLVSHLVGQEQGLVASLLVAHGVGRSSNCHHHQCEKQLLHNRIVLNC